MANNATSASPGGSVKLTPKNSPQHKRMALGTMPKPKGGPSAKP